MHNTSKTISPLTMTLLMLVSLMATGCHTVASRPATDARGGDRSAAITAAVIYHLLGHNSCAPFLSIHKSKIHLCALDRESFYMLEDSQLTGKVLFQRPIERSLVDETHPLCSCDVVLARSERLFQLDGSAAAASVRIALDDELTLRTADLYIYPKNNRLEVAVNTTSSRICFPSSLWRIPGIVGVSERSAMVLGWVLMKI